MCRYRFSIPPLVGMTAFTDKVRSCTSHGTADRWPGMVSA
ncbi:hypothetical protein CLOBOL_00416 [Enterocloster bolteae ATCC BAA-613]|uniref:Uncharacterized protein n=1 Tax=Enterocloster bolteae (strain ATCC BAA-613 / DSM 15670 / CCUG 46953 / JCM 12243 / WAL 16351) TaxID=411902 RepID=A8RHG9_ENTBW|nr:hypothetical protein CLOBOL_00416 [Enterocloster bolteae ATCC BAA-613]